MAHIQSWATADTFLRNGRNPQSRWIGSGRRTTFVERRDASDDIAIRQHQTDIIRYRQDGTIALDSGGWRTVTTKERLNSLSPARIDQENGIWYVAGPGDNWEARRVGRTLFYDGMIVDANGQPLHPKQAARTEDFKRQVDRMVSRYVAGFMADIRAHGLGEPGAGDCLMCQARAGALPQTHFGRLERVNGEIVQTDTTGQPEVLGVDHYLAHMAEKYYVRSLMWNAIQRRGNPAFCWRWAAGGGGPDLLRGDLQHFLRQLKPTLVAELEKGWYWDADAQDGRYRNVGAGEAEL